MVLGIITADESTSIRDKAALFSKMSVDILDRFDVILGESSQIRTLYDQYREDISNKPILKMDYDLKVFEDKNSQINQHFAHQKVESQKMGNEVAELKEANDEIMRGVFEVQTKLKEMEQRIGVRIVRWLNQSIITLFAVVPRSQEFFEFDQIPLPNFMSVLLESADYLLLDYPPLIAFLAKTALNLVPN